MAEENLRNLRNDIIDRALTLIGARAANEEADEADVKLAAGALDDIVKLWQASGAHLWSRNHATVFLQPDQVKYRLGPDTLDHVTENFTISNLGADVAAGDVVITLKDTFADANSDVKELESGDYIGIKRPSGRRFWTKVKSVKPTIRLEDPAPEDLKEDALVFFYKQKIGKALRVPDARRQHGLPPTNSEIEMTQLGRIDYLNLPNKQTRGTPVQFYHDPKRTHSELFIWPAPTSVNEYVNFTYYRPLDVFDDSADVADFPDEWILALKYNLAINIAPDIMGGVEPSQRTFALAQDYYNRALEWDQGDASVFFEPEMGRGRQKTRAGGRFR